ncbi:hypothetical protein [Psychroflexus sp. MES1-P1E]|uniref:hypothetical protein n=1 Tax=Psychroflexus sp. MES1-P1E TaxID=2058320 RepID=UPI000C7B219A|nr:hypothetical protein [Psychroflexus sp. MES1-P1E]PKG42775.1 hypothetical protein CXF67_08490 [Psychroflexus sp. MES1-P1E]
MTKKLTLKIGIGLTLLIGLIYFIDPAFQRSVTFDSYSAKYEWRLFNNSYCNSKTAGHCFTNETNRTNAEIELYLTLLEHVESSEQIEKKLKKVVKETYRFERTYSELTQTDEIRIDSLRKYRDEIFRKIMLK